MAALLDYTLTRTVAPTIEPVMLAAAKVQCSLDLDDPEFDAWFESREGNVGAIQAAREMVESNASICLMPQTWQLQLDNWGSNTFWSGDTREPWRRPLGPYGDFIDLHVHPVKAISSVTYRDEAGVTRTWDSSNYELLKSGFRSVLLKPDSLVLWPLISTTRLRGITVTMVAGYATDADDTDAKKRAAVPAAARKAMLTLIAHWFKNREAVVVGSAASAEVEQSYCALIDTIRPRRYT